MDRVGPGGTQGAVHTPSPSSPPSGPSRWKTLTWKLDPEEVPCPAYAQHPCPWGCVAIGHSVGLSTGTSAWHPPAPNSLPSLLLHTCTIGAASRKPGPTVTAIKAVLGPWDVLPETHSRGVTDPHRSSQLRDSTPSSPKAHPVSSKANGAVLKVITFQSSNWPKNESTNKT